MPSAIVFDTYNNVKRLKAVGFTEEQAEAQTRIIAELVNEQLVTKHDLEELKNDLTLRLSGMLGAAVAIVAALVKLL